MIPFVAIGFLSATFRRISQMQFVTVSDSSGFRRFLSNKLSLSLLLTMSYNTSKNKTETKFNILDVMAHVAT